MRRTSEHVHLEGILLDTMYEILPADVSKVVIDERSSMVVPLMIPENS